MSAAYSLQHITVSYDRHQEALRDFSATFHTGQMVAIIGPNGCGKSTLLRTLAGLTTPDSGTVFYHDRQLNTFSLAELANERAYLPAADETSGSFLVEEIVLLGRYGHTPFGFTSQQDSQLAHQALQLVEADSLAHRQLATLSSGEKQRVAAARLFCQNSPLLLLDEPTNYLDPTHQHLLLRQLRLATDQGHTVIAVIHDLRLARRYFNRFLLLDAGQLAADLTAEDLENSPELARIFALSPELLFN